MIAVLRFRRRDVNTTLSNVQTSILAYVNFNAKNPWLWLIVFSVARFLDDAWRAVGRKYLVWSPITPPHRISSKIYPSVWIHQSHEQLPRVYPRRDARRDASIQEILGARRCWILSSLGGIGFSVWDRCPSCRYGVMVWKLTIVFIRRNSFNARQATDNASVLQFMIWHVDVIA